MKISVFLTAALFAASLAMQGCSGKAPEAETPGEQAEAPQAMAVGVALIEGRTVERSVETTGSLFGWDEVVVTSEASGLVESVGADLGDPVKRGSVLAALDQREARLGLEQARAAHATSLRAQEREKARLDEAEANHRRYEELFRKEMVSASQYDDMRTRLDVASAQSQQAKAGVEEAAARLALAEKRLSDATVRSPIDGVVSRRMVSRGEYVKENAAAFIVVSTGRLKYRGTVAEASVPLVKAGQELTIAVDAHRGVRFSGALTRVGPSVDSRTRTLEVEASVPDAKGMLRPGFFARGTVSAGQEAGVAFVHESAVYSFVGIDKIFIIEDGVARERIVRLGARDGQMVEVAGEGVAPGQKAATSNLANLFDGAAVAVQD